MKKNVLLFGGQGTHYIGMGKELYANNKKAKYVFDEASNILGYDIGKICFYNSGNLLNTTLYSQLAIIVFEIALYSVFEEYNIPIDIVAGMSLGEYSAMYSAGMIELKDLLQLVQFRAIAMEKEIPNNLGMMLAVINCPYNELKLLCENIGVENCNISNYNSKDNISIALKSEYYSRVYERIKELGGIAIPLKLTRPFHHILMKPAADLFNKHLATIKFASPNKIIYSNYTGQIYKNTHSFNELLYKQIYNPVLWKAIMDDILSMKDVVFYEISPKPILSGFITKSNTARYINLKDLLDIHF